MPGFHPLLPHRAPVNLSLIDTPMTYRTPGLAPIPGDPDHVRLTVARPAHGGPAHADSERAVLYLDALTHMHRENLEAFLLERHGDWHVGAFDIPAGLRTGAGFLLCDPFDPDTGRSREQWHAALDRLIPLQPTLGADRLTDLDATRPFESPEIQLFETR